MSPPLPDVQHALTNFAVQVELLSVEQAIVDFKPVENTTSKFIFAVVQSADKKKLMPDLVDYAKEYLLIHSHAIMRVGDYINHNNIKYLIIDVKNQSSFYEATAEEVNA
jgi:hypothetical protein